MPKNNKEYIFNYETFSFEEVKDPFRIRLYRFVRKGIVIFIFVCIANLVFSSIYYTPKRRKLEEANTELLQKYRILDGKIAIASHKLSELKYRDNNIYRLIFAADTLALPEVYNPYPAERYAYLANNTYSPVIVGAWQDLDDVTRRLYLQSRSLDQLQELASNKERLASAVPAIWPIDRRGLRNMDHYGRRLHPIYKVWKFHQGIDLGGRIGDEIYATGNAVVKSTSKGQARVGYGQQVLLDHGFGYQTRYAHLSKIEVVPGQVVRRGEVIGRMGSTGGSTGPHLHYEIIHMNQTVDPINYLKRDMSDSEFESIVSAAKTTTFETDLQ